MAIIDIIQEREKPIIIDSAILCGSPETSTTTTTAPSPCNDIWTHFDKTKSCHKIFSINNLLQMTTIPKKIMFGSVVRFKK
uniref:C-type lectin domain-containing protein n=1 Tax=Acrobeloides nanus TaxID=290746 RepID=A0A914DHC1_9BILA